MSKDYLLYPLKGESLREIQKGYGVYMVYLVASLRVDLKSGSTAEHWQPEVKEKIENLKVPFHQENNIFFVSFDGTTSELNEKIGFGEDSDIGFGFVMPVTNYAGFAFKSLWEWIKTYDKT